MREGVAALVQVSGSIFAIVVCGPWSPRWRLWPAGWAGDSCAFGALTLLHFQCRPPSKKRLFCPKKWGPLHRSAFPQKGRNTLGPLISLNPAIYSCWMLAHYNGYLLNFSSVRSAGGISIKGWRALNRFTAVCQAFCGIDTKSGVHGARSPRGRSGAVSWTGMRSSLRLPSSLADDGVHVGIVNNHEPLGAPANRSSNFNVTDIRFLNRRS